MKKVETWIDRITNDSNLWLNAINAEDEGNYLNAFSFYLKDAEECFKQNSPAATALSCSCAASCLISIGNLTAARQLHVVAAMLYEKNAEKVIGQSVRESLWSYRQAYEYYNVAGETGKADRVYEKYVSLSRKVNPFHGENDAMELLRGIKVEVESGLKPHSTNMEISADIEDAIQKFLNEISLKTEGTQVPFIRKFFATITGDGEEN